MQERRLTQALCTTLGSHLCYVVCGETFQDFLPSCFTMSVNHAPACSHCVLIVRNRSALMIGQASENSQKHCSNTRSKLGDRDCEPWRFSYKTNCTESSAGMLQLCNANVDPWNTIKRPKRDDQLTFSKRGKAIQRRKDARWAGLGQHPVSCGGGRGGERGGRSLACRPSLRWGELQDGLRQRSPCPATDSASDCSKIAHFRYKTTSAAHRQMCRIKGDEKGRKRKSCDPKEGK